MQDIQIKSVYKGEIYRNKQYTILQRSFTPNVYQYFKNKRFDTLFICNR